ncbi:MAG: TIGR01777 family oxidoreductase [Elusimicrobiota bacterium]
MKVIIAGGTGFIGGAIISALVKRGDAVVLLTRTPAAAQQRWGKEVDARLWNARDPGPWVLTLDGADAVINLVGANVGDGRWTPERKLILIKSRLDATRVLCSAMAAAVKRPGVLINASAVGYYGTSRRGDCPEDAPQGSDFLAALCGQWEREALAAEKLGVRVVLSRFGVVLDPGQGALAKMLPPFRYGLGGRLGSGRQPFAWIHRDDAVASVLFLIESSLGGAVNITAPDAKTNAAFSKALGRALRRPALIPVPAFALRLALGEMSGMLLGGQRAVPKKLLDAGYAFSHPELDAALRDVLR